MNRRQRLKAKRRQAALQRAAVQIPKEEPVQVEEGSPMWRRATKVILLVIGLFLIAYDFLPFMDQARHDTISEVIAEYSLKLITIPLVFGALCGHFFFMRDNTKPKPWVTIPVLIASIAFDAVSYKYNVEC